MNGSGEKPALRDAKEALERRLYEHGGSKAVETYRKEVRDALLDCDRRRNGGK